MNRFVRLAAVAALALGLAGRAAPAAGLPSKPGPDPARYAGEYGRMKEPSWRGGFPNLRRFEVLAPSTGRDGKAKAYNCIAHTLRVYDRWVWPGGRVADFDRLYGEQGYRRVRGLDYRFRPDLEKVVLYAKTLPGGGSECTHGSRQLADGTWTSKLGAGPLIRHASPESVSGPSYGRPVAVYVRPRKVPAPGAAKPARPAPAKTNRADTLVASAAP
jgi:hypothetical protein